MFDPHILDENAKAKFLEACALEDRMLAQGDATLDGEFGDSDADIASASAIYIALQVERDDCIMALAALTGAMDDEIYEAVEAHGTFNRNTRIMNETMSNTPDDMIMDNGMTAKEFREFALRQMNAL